MKPHRIFRPFEIIAILILLAILLPIAIITIGNVKEEMKNEVGSSLEAILKTTEDSFKLWKERRKIHISTITDNPDLIKITKDLLRQSRDKKTLCECNAQKKLRDFSKPILDETGDLGIFIIAPDYTSLGSMRDQNIGTKNLIAEQKKSLLDKAFEGDIILIPPIISDVELYKNLVENDRPDKTMFIAAPIKDENKEIIAVFSLRIDIESDFNRIVKLGRIGESGETYVFDRNGILLSASRFENTFKYKGQALKDFSIFKVSDPGGNMIADSCMIETVIRNLVTNALKYCEEDGMVRIQAIEKGDNVEICIKDNGIGMDEYIQKRLFTLNNSVSVPGTADERGTGLGLIICKEFIEKNDGEIAVESKLGKGSVFKFYLPINSN